MASKNNSQPKLTPVVVKILEGEYDVTRDELALWSEKSVKEKVKDIAEAIKKFKVARKNDFNPFMSKELGTFSNIYNQSYKISETNSIVNFVERLRKANTTIINGSVNEVLKGNLAKLKGASLAVSKMSYGQYIKFVLYLASTISSVREGEESSATTPGAPGASATTPGAPGAPNNNNQNQIMKLVTVLAKNILKEPYPGSTSRTPSGGSS